MSDIPQFDEDSESIVSFSLDNSIEHEIFETIQFIIDSIIDEEVNLKSKNRFNKSTYENSLKITTNNFDVNSNIKSKLLTSSLHNTIQDNGVDAFSDENLMSKSAITQNLNNSTREELPAYKSGRFKYIIIYYNY